MYDRIIKNGRIVSYEEESNGIKVIYDNGDYFIFNSDRRENIREKLRDESEAYAECYKEVNALYKDKVSSIIYAANAVAGILFLGITLDPLVIFPTIYCTAYGIMNGVFYRKGLKRIGIENGISAIKLRREVRELEKYKLFFEREEDILEFVEKENDEGNLSKYSFTGDIKDLSETSYNEIKTILKLSKKK